MSFEAKIHILSGVANFNRQNDFGTPRSVLRNLIPEDEDIWFRTIDGPIFALPESLECELAALQRGTGNGQ